MIDYTQPMELDDGRPVEPAGYTPPEETYNGRGMIRARFDGPHMRRGGEGTRRAWSYYADNGEWIDDPANRRFRLRNVEDEPVVEEDWS